MSKMLFSPLCLNILLKSLLKTACLELPSTYSWLTQSQQEWVKHCSSFFYLKSVSSVIVTRLLFITADTNSYHEVEDEPQSVIVISVVGEKSFLYFLRFMFIF